jgi:hypothetical protein
MVKRSFVCGAFALALLTGCATAATTTRPLFNGHDFSDFQLTTLEHVPLESVYAQRPDGVITAAGKPLGFLATKASYTNYKLHVEFRWTGKPGNGGILLHIASGPKDKVWPLAQQVQTKHGNLGDLLPMAGATFAEPLTTAPGAYPPIKARTAADSEKPVGQWNAVDVVCRDGSIEVRVNGVLQNRVTHSNPSSGPVGFQLEGTPYELRNVTITPLD